MAFYFETSLAEFHWEDLKYVCQIWSYSQRLIKGVQGLVAVSGVVVNQDKVALY